MSMDDLRHPDCRYCNEYERVTKGLVSERNELKRQLRGEGADDLLDEQEYRAIDRAIPGAVSAPKEESPAAVPVDGVVVNREDLATVMQVADYRMRFAGRWQSEQDAYDRLRASLVAADKGENDG